MGKNPTLQLYAKATQLIPSANPPTHPSIPSIHSSNSSVIYHYQHPSLSPFSGNGEIKTIPALCSLQEYTAHRMESWETRRATTRMLLISNNY